MAFVTFSFKIDDALDPDVVAWLKASENRSIDIRKALRHYLDLPPRDETPASPAPIDGAAMASLFKDAIREGMSEAAGQMGKAVGSAVAQELKKITIPISLPLNGNGHDLSIDERANLTDDPEATVNAAELFVSQFG